MNFTLPEEEDFSHSASPQQRSRVRETDFHSIENPPQNHSLSPYELEVRYRLAASSSPVDELAREEDEKNARIENFVFSRHLLPKGQFTERQMIFYVLYFYFHYQDKEIARILMISRSRVRTLRKAVEKKLKETRERQKKEPFLYRACKTRKQRLILDHYIRECLSPKEIAHLLGISKRAVNRVLQRIRKRAAGMFCEKDED